MPASIAHMLIAAQARNKLLTDNDQDVVKFATDVLDKHPEYMSLGSLGPDLPYFRPSSLWDPNKPIGVDQWSYQLHSKTPNIFPLQMIELVWRESNPRSDWVEGDNCKFAFLCGFLTHVAADQIIHPLVNFIAGRYSHSRDARTEHRTCEIHQDLYVLSQQKFGGHLTVSQFQDEHFHSDCDIVNDHNRGDLSKNEFLYFIQKAFVEAHAVKPWLWTLKSKLVFLYLALSACRSQRWYKDARKNLFAADGEPRRDAPEYREYISLERIPDRNSFLEQFEGKRHYQDFLNEAVDLAVIYIRAAHEIYRAPRADDSLRGAFLKVVANADLGVPLQRRILQEARKNLPALRGCVHELWARHHARHWLGLVDDCQRKKRWDAATARLACTVSKEDILKSLTQKREPLGGVASRDSGSAQCVTGLQGAPEGEYVVVTFTTSFENNQSAVERVTMVLDEDRTWRTFSYTIGQP